MEGSLLLKKIHTQKEPHRIQQKQNKIKMPPKPPYRCLPCVCLVVAGGLTQDLTLILSTKNTEQNKTKKRKPKQ